MTLIDTAQGKALIGLASFDHGNNEIVFKSELFNGILQHALPAPHQYILEPLPVDCSGPNTGTPCPILISRLSDKDYKTLLEKKAFDTEKGCIIVHKPNPPISQFLFRIEGLPSRDSTEARKNVIMMVATTVVNIRGIAKKLASLGEYPGINPDENLHHFLKSLRAVCIEMLTKKKNASSPQLSVPVWLIYGTPFTSDLNVHHYFVQKIKLEKFKWTHGMAVEAVIGVDDYFCRICFGVDHPTGLCPFRNIPGFRGNNFVNPTPNDVTLPAQGDVDPFQDTPINSTTNFNNRSGSRGRGGRGGTFRGRGNGRGF